MQQKLLLLLAPGALGNSSTCTSYAETALSVLQGWYNQSSGLWDTAGWWNGANAMTTIADLAALDSNVASTATSVFAHTFTQALAANPNAAVAKIAGPGVVQTTYGVSGSGGLARRENEASGFTDSCYDDNGWWALAWIAAYDLTSNADYLSTASTIFAQMQSGGPTNCSAGGIIWCSNSAYYVNAIANELYLSVAAHLSNRMSNGNDYYSLAQSQWSWFQDSGLINADNLINDGLNLDCTNNGMTVWSYNQGVILGALVEMHRHDSSEPSYLSSAATLASASIANLTDSNHVLVEYGCGQNCGGDGSQFKGIYIRNLVALHQAAPQDEYALVIDASAASIWKNDRDANNKLSQEWQGPFVSPANASTHSSAMDALVAAIVTSNE